MRRNWKFLRGFLIFLGILLALEIALQLGFRVMTGNWIAMQNSFRVDHIVAQDDPRAYTYKPNFRDPAEGLTIDQFGFRTSLSLPAPPPGSKVVATLGDSVPFGHGLKDEETYPFELSRLLINRGSPLGVVNAGVSSYNLRQSIEHFRRDVLPHYRPAIVTLQAANDVGLVLHYRGAWTPEITWEPHRRGILSSLLPRSATLATVGPFLQSIFQGSGPVPSVQMLKYEEELLNEFAQECTQIGTTLILLPIDLFYYQTAHTEKNAHLSRWEQWSQQSKGWGTVFDDYNRVMAEVARRKGPESGVYFFDTRSYLDKLDRERLYIDSIHYSPEGNRRVAQGLMEFMTAKGLL